MAASSGNIPSLFRVVSKKGAIVREDIDTKSPEVAKIPHNTVVQEVQRVGRRSQIDFPHRGWISALSRKNNKILVPELTLYKITAPKGAKVRKGFELDSEEIGIIGKNKFVSRVQIQKRRLQIDFPLKGWISIKSKQGYHLASRYNFKAMEEIVEKRIPQEEIKKNEEPALPQIEQKRAPRQSLGFFSSFFGGSPTTNATNLAAIEPAPKRKPAKAEKPLKQAKAKEPPKPAKSKKPKPKKSSLKIVKKESDKPKTTQKKSNKVSQYLHQKQVEANKGRSRTKSRSKSPKKRNSARISRLANMFEKRDAKASADLILPKAPRGRPKSPRRSRSASPMPTDPMKICPHCTKRIYPNDPSIYFEKRNWHKGCHTKWEYDEAIKAGKDLSPGQGVDRSQLKIEDTKKDITERSENFIVKFNCAKCHEDFFYHEEHVEFNKKQYHPACIRCSKCDKRFAHHEPTKNVSGDPWCKRCWFDEFGEEWMARGHDEGENEDPVAVLKGWEFHESVATVMNCISFKKILYATFTVHDQRLVIPHLIYPYGSDGPIRFTPDTDLDSISKQKIPRKIRNARSKPEFFQEFIKSLTILRDDANIGIITLTFKKANDFGEKDETMLYFWNPEDITKKQKIIFCTAKDMLHSEFPTTVLETGRMKDLDINVTLDKINGELPEN